ncbi:RNA polymerase sigma factor [Flavobacterium sp. 38-13]|uniref:RNA polymerase sigma factor n=2 Tax=Flavobacterium TaxID=237 RepID=UPI000AF3698F|nr:RNA polymerase sigma factor [Flavobacterium sp. 38-13]
MKKTRLQSWLCAITVGEIVLLDILNRNHYELKISHPLQMKTVRTTSTILARYCCRFPNRWEYGFNLVRKIQINLQTFTLPPQLSPHFNAISLIFIIGASTCAWFSSNFFVILRYFSMKTQKLYDEQELLRRLKSGDHNAFEKIFHRYKSKMAQNAVRVLRSSALSQDLVQELFIRLWEQRSKIDTDKTLGAYLYKIASNLAHDYFRKAGRDQKLREQLLAISPVTYDPIEKVIYNKEDKLLLDKALSMLPEQQRAVFTLCKVEERSYQEVAELLNISIGTVNNHLTRANRSLRALLQKAQSPAPLLAALLLQGIL